MPLVIGLDTGGTFTDAALLDTDRGMVLATAKSLTTRADLSVGLGRAIAKILASFDGKPSQVDLVTLSTTLATNAVVEGVGGRVGLFLIGFDQTALERADLARALGQDPVTFVAGGHRPDGGMQQPLDLAAIEAAAKRLKSEVSAFAIAGHFATRNPLHEVEARDLLRRLTGLPITCSHELSSSLGGPRRALTAVLNARLINLLERLIAGTQHTMTEQGLSCPLMVVKGDGSLLEADFAHTRPVETVLSGPAASLSGAAFLAGTSTALVADIGGTTTDIAFLQNGTPRLKPDGALVGGWQTMVEAAEIRTCGLGGDSEVQPILRGRAGGLTLGPRRAVPLCLMARDWPQIVDHLAAQLDLAIPVATDGRFVFPVMPDGVPGWLTRSEARLAEKARASGPTPVAELAATQLALGAVDRLISRGLLGLCAFTPTDAAHVTGAFTEFDSTAAQLGAALMARQRSGAGQPIAQDAEALAAMTLGELHRRSALALLDAAMAHDGGGEGAVSGSPLLAAAFGPDARRTGRLVNAGVQLNSGLVALGASAATHYPAIAAALAVPLTVPEHADVAGAVGAAAGAVRQRVMISITQPVEGKFRLHLPQGPVDKASLDDALAAARLAARTLAETRAARAGAGNISVETAEDINQVTLGGGKDLFIEARVYATASGRPA
jgi:N-methylhydantoinase A/oxoprolinase/acetone carboxylase beta subunit